MVAAKTPAPKTAKPAPFKIPKEQGQWPDLLNELKLKRAALQKQADEIEAQEKQLKAHIIDTLPKSDATGIIGAQYKVTILEKTIPQVDTENDGWTKLYDYIKKNKAFHLLQKRLSDTAINELWDAGKAVPGVKTFTAKTVSLTKR